MEQHFYVLFDPKESLFFRDHQFGGSKDILKAERYRSYEEAESVLKYLDKNKWTVRKVTVKLEEN